MASTIDPTTGLPITNQAIPTSALSTPQTPLTITPPADTTPILNSALNTGASTVQQGLDAVTLEQKAAQEQQKRVEGAGTVADLTRMAGGRLQERANLAQTNGENELLKQISGYNTQAQGLIREATAIPLQTGAAYQGSSGTQAGVASVNRDLLQRNALQSLTLAQSAAIAQGNYDVAKNLADQQVNAKYAQIDAEIAARKINEEALYKNITDPAIKKALEARMALTKKEEQAIAEQKAEANKISDLIINAQQQGASPDMITKAQKARTPLEAAAALGVYAGNYVQNEYIKSQTAKNYADAIESKVKANLARTAALAGGTPAEIKAKVEAKTAQITQAQNILGLVNDIAGSTGLARGTGFSSLLNVVPGTTGKDFEVTVDQLKNALALPNLGQLKGAMSDKDIMFLKNIATKLDTSMSEPEFKKELTKLQDKFTEVLTNNGVSPEALTDEYFKAQEKARVESQSTKSKDEQFLNSL